MSNFFKFGGIFLMSAFAFAGIYLLKITLDKIIPTGSSTEMLLRTMPQIFFKEKFWLAMLCYGAAMIVYLFLLQGNQASKIFSITVGVNVLLTAIGSVLFLGDTIGGVRAIGIFLIVVGIFLINGSG